MEQAKIISVLNASLRGFHNLMSAEPRLASGTSKSENSLFKRLPPQSIVYWSRIGFAVMAGAIYNLLGLSTQGLIIGTVGAIGIGVLLYALSVLIVKYVFDYGPDILAGPRKHISIGMGSYVIWLVFTMILLNTIIHPAPP